jgi:acyl-[acyl-carrier-protein]-phospholipid O-acyltransferase/long-chain-fatty-acid--[acyl-carrier-protein] ligase
VNIPETGGVLLVSNHLTWADGVLLSIHCQRDVRLIAYDENIRGGFLKWMAKIFRVIPINYTSGPKALLRSLQTASQALKEGDVVVIFAEGAISRIGVLLPFQRGLLRIIEGTDAPVIPVYLDELWGSVFSFSGGRFFWKVPRKWPYPITIMYGEPIQKPKSVFEVRQAVQELAVDAAEHRKPRMRALPRRFIRECRRKLWKLKVADSTNQELTGGSLLTRSLVLRRLLGRTLAADEKMVGVYLPSSSGGVIVNAALALMRRVAVNLNYTMSSSDLQAQIELCGIKHVLTSRKFIEKIPLETTAQLVYLEDFAPQVTGLDKFIAATQAFALPAIVLEHWLGLHHIQPDDILTVIFTSGSTGEPKGVCLTHHNVASNIDAIDQLFDLSAKDMLLGVLPFFHSFGYTGTLWTVLSLKARGVYHYNPLDARVVGKMCEKYGVTITMTTPTFLRTYIKRCEKEQFAKIDLVVTGAERLPPDVADAFEQKFGVRPSEGYGTTELSPLASVNVPDHRGSNFVQQGSKPGTVGRPVPGVTAKVVDPETNAELGPNEPGMLLIRGSNVMQGYLHRADRTAQVVRDGWYVTGDIARIDDEGFITITDRLSRFSKIGGEMVPHIKIEELLTKILTEPEDEGPELRAVVTAVSDDKKGERIVVIHKPLSKTIEQVCQELAEAGLPNLWIPSPENFVAVEEIPVLGTGKLDLKGVKALAQERLGAHV